MTLTPRVAIVGGGLAGLHAAGLLERAGKLDIVAAQRQPTVHDLLRHTSGFTYGGCPSAQRNRSSTYSRSTVRISAR